MQTDYTSKQSLQFMPDDEEYHLVELEIGLHCTAASYGGHFNHITGDAEPPSGPEFEITTITADVPSVNPYGKPGGSSMELTYDQLCALFSQRVADKLIDDAIEEASNQGGF